MSKKLVIVNALALILLIITSICTILFLFSKDDDSSQSWFKKTGNGYTVTGKMLGVPSIAGTSKALIEIYDHDREKIIIQFKTGIDTDHRSLSDDNYALSFNDDHISLTFYNANGTISGSYRFYYEDLISEMSSHVNN